MVDEFMVCVDRIIASAACFQESPVNITVEREGEEQSVVNVVVSESGGGGNNNDGVFVVGCSYSGSAKGGVKECRICQEEDEEKDMEAPCACNGTLKFAHRKCIQRWCNKKGDIICEICNQVFSPNYSSPPPRSNADVMAIDIRQAWGPHIDLRDPRLLAFAAAERQFLQSEYDDYALANSGSLTCFRTVALILMLILLIRQTLMLTRDFGMLRESSFFVHIVCAFGDEIANIPKFLMSDTRYAIRFPFFSWLVFFFPAMWWLVHCTLYNAEGGGRVEAGTGSS